MLKFNIRFTLHLFQKKKGWNYSAFLKKGEGFKYTWKSES